MMVLDGSFGGRSERVVSLVLAGGVALGMYEAGAYAALHEHPDLRPEWLAGSSIGAVTAALIAGNPPERRIQRLRDFWEATDPFPMASSWMGQSTGALRQAQNGASVLQTMLFGRPGLFRPRLALGFQVGAQDVPALFDVGPMAERLAEMVDFDLLNDGAVRLAISCTDVITGERVVFDTGHGDRIGPQHVLASCALLPLFAPVEVEGRLLADGCLGANTPLDLVLDEREAGEVLCFVVELFARQGSRPHTIAASASRAGDLAFGNQTRRILEGLQRERHLRSLIGQLAAQLPDQVRDDPAVASILAKGRVSRATVATIAYRAGLDEAGMLKPFDFSRATLADRWAAGGEAMRHAIAAVSELPSDHAGELTVIDA
jgi:NTE family protein